MNKVRVQINPWDKDKIFEYENLDLKLGDKVLVSVGNEEEIGTIIDFTDGDSVSVTANANPESKDQNRYNKDDEALVVKRKAELHDLERMATVAEKEKAFFECKKFISQHDLPMKLVDVHFSFDSSKMVFAFIADGRVDFRDLVKDLTRTFNKTIRLQQLGIRDEARISGDTGHCGRELCCRGFLTDLVSITSDMAEVQQCVHRGSDRISGVCGRLMCCLSYENVGYTESIEKMPKIGTKVNVDGRRGVIIGLNPLKQSVNVEFPPGKGERGTVRVEVDLNRNKKKK